MKNCEYEQKRNAFLHHSLYIHPRLPTCTLGLIVESSSFTNSRQSSRPCRSLPLFLSFFLGILRFRIHALIDATWGFVKGNRCSCGAMFKDNCDRSRGHVSLSPHCAFCRTTWNFPGSWSRRGPLPKALPYANSTAIHRYIPGEYIARVEASFLSLFAYQNLSNLRVKE